VARIIHPASKASYGSRQSTDTVSSTLSEILNVLDAHSEELYEAMDTLSERQKEIEQSLAVKHLWEGSLILT
jgi:gas vesicle protein